MYIYVCKILTENYQVVVVVGKGGGGGGGEEVGWLPVGG